MTKPKPDPIPEWPEADPNAAKSNGEAIGRLAVYAALRSALVPWNMCDEVWAEMSGRSVPSTLAAIETEILTALRRVLWRQQNGK